MNRPLGRPHLAQWPFIAAPNGQRRPYLCPYQPICPTTGTCCETTTSKPAVCDEQHAAADKPGSAAAHPGVYCLRTTLVDWDDATLWRTYTMLTDLESVFRSLKTDLGLRPVFHRIEPRVEGHLFISVLAYHFVHMLRLQLKAQGIDDAWQTLRETMASQQRVSATLQRRDGRTVHVRKATRPEPRHLKINTILGLASNPGGTHRVLV